MSHCLTYSIFQQNRTNKEPFSQAQCIYSLRLINTEYSGYCIKVRRSTDNAEQDIGFSLGVLDESTLTAFIGSGDGFVSIWYDQSNNNYNATQTNQLLQPKIIISGVVSKLNDLPSIYFNKSSLRTTDTLNYDSNRFCFFGFLKTTGTTQSFLTVELDRIIYLANEKNYLGAWVEWGLPYSWKLNTLSSFTNVGSLVNVLILNGTNCFINFNEFDYFYKYNSAQFSGTHRIEIGGRDDPGYNRMIGWISEVIIYNINAERFKKKIKLNINNFYSIY